MPQDKYSLKIVLLQFRPHHWIKNILILFPVFFAGEALSLDIIYPALVGFAAFSFVASAVYILNDIQDIEFDQKHPVKKNRPIASGALSIKTGQTLMVSLMLVGGSMAFWINVEFGLIIVAYIGINVLYSFWLKNITIIDVVVIALGFLLRVFAGGVLATLDVSPWLIILTFLLAIFLALSKRRDDLLFKEENNVVLRSAINGYNLKFIDGAMAVFAGIIIVCYLLYTLSDEVTLRMSSEYIYLTAIPAIIGLLRYIQLIIVGEGPVFPVEILFKDWLIRSVVLIWFVSFSLIIYVF